MLGAGDPAQQVTRAPQLGQEPEHRDQREQGDDQLACPRIAPEQIQPVRTPDEPQLGPVQRGEEAHHEGAPARSVQMAVDGDQRQRRRQPFRVAERVVRDEPARVDQAARRDQPGQQRRDQGQAARRSVGLCDPGDEVARESPGELEHHRHRHHRPGARDDQPQIGLRRCRTARTRS